MKKKTQKKNIEKRPVASAIMKKSATAKKTPKSTHPRNRRAEFGRSKPTSKTSIEDIVRELKVLRNLVAPKPSLILSPDAALENGVDSLRRLLVELVDAHSQYILGKLGSIWCSATGAHAAILDPIEQLLQDLGAIRFQAERTDSLDPLIHTVVEERHAPELPQGVIVETLRPGYRTSRGVILAKARVAVNRRT